MSRHIEYLIGIPLEVHATIAIRCQVFSIVVPIGEIPMTRVQAVKIYIYSGKEKACSSVLTPKQRDLENCQEMGFKSWHRLWAGISLVSNVKLN